MKKRIVATILALCLVLGLVPGTAWADFGPSISEEPPAAPPEIQTVTWNGWDVQYYCPTPSDAYYELSGGRGVVICYANGNSTRIDIPAQIGGQPVVGLVALGGYGLGVSGASNTVFGDCKQLTSVNIPNSVTHIVDAFHGCTSLISVTIPDSVTYIGKAAFMDCKALTRVSIPDSVTYIGDGAFAWCRNLTDATIPSNVTTLGCWSFYYTALTDITIPDAITRIEKGVFADSKLTNINIPVGVASIGDSAFDFCRNLTNVTIPNSVTSIGEAAFGFCRSLTNITIPNSVTCIGRGAFVGCDKLSDIQVGPDNLSYASVDGVLFSKDKTKLVKYPERKQGAYIIPSGVASIEDMAFYGCKSLTDVTIPNSITSIGETAFHDCKNLKNVTIPNSITSIDHHTFGGCSSLTNVTIPNSVTSIGDGAFWDCDSLTDVYYSGNEDDWKRITISTFSNEPLVNATIHYNSTGPDTPDTPSGDLTATVLIKGGKYIDSSGNGDLAIVSDTGDTVCIPAGTTDLVLDFAVSTNGILFSDDNVIDGRPNSNLIIFEGNCGLTATEAAIYREDGILFLAFNGLAKSGSFDITITGLVDADGRSFVSNKLHVVVQGNDTPPDTPDEKGVRVDFFPNRGTITSIKGYSREQIIQAIMQGNGSVPEDILFIDVNSGVAGMMTDENGILSEFPVIEREGYTFDGWWYTDDRDLIYSAYKNEITDFTNMERVDLSTNFVDLADSPKSGRDVIAKWNKNSDASSGDLTGDGEIGISDVVKLARAVAGHIQLTAQEQMIGDVTGDGEIGISDVVKLARFVAGHITSL